MQRNDAGDINAVKAIITAIFDLLRRTDEGLPFIEPLSLLVEHEQLRRDELRQARLIKEVSLKLQATVPELA